MTISVTDSMTIPMTLSGNKSEKKKRIGWYTNLLTEFKKEQIGYSTIALLGQSCIGSLAAMSLLMGDMQTGIKMTLLFLVAIFSMVYNGAVLAQLRLKATFNLLILSVVFSRILIIAHLM